MNILLNIISTELSDLKMGLTGELNQTDKMEKLLQNLLIVTVPEEWIEKYAYESLKSTVDFWAELNERWA